MADTRSGAGQVFAVETATAGTYETLSGPDHDFGGFDDSFDPATFTTESGGLQTERNAGTMTRTGSFTIGETDTTNALFLGQNGIRRNIRWRKTAGVAGVQLSVILTISQTFTAVDKRMYSIDVHVDGAPTAWPA
ncbi:MAG: hypothetical protein OXQ29_06565 [Rhodospirillaceae bacterium]|nr:hypothetical protein [Rhodospirillaceae bacterium]